MRHAVHRGSTSMHIQLSCLQYPINFQGALQSSHVMVNVPAMRWKDDFDAGQPNLLILAMLCALPLTVTAPLKSMLMEQSQDDHGLASKNNKSTKLSHMHASPLIM